MVETTTVTNLGVLLTSRHGDALTADCTIETEEDDSNSDAFMLADVKEAEATLLGALGDAGDQGRILLTTLDYFAMREDIDRQAFASDTTTFWQDKGLALNATTDSIFESVLLLASQAAHDGDTLWHWFHFRELKKRTHTKDSWVRKNFKKWLPSRSGATFGALPSVHVEKDLDHDKPYGNVIFQSGSVRFEAGSICCNVYNGDGVGKEDRKLPSSGE